MPITYVVQLTKSFAGHLVREVELAEEVENQLKLAASEFAQIGKDLASSKDARYLASRLRHAQLNVDTARALSEVLEQQVAALTRQGRAH